MVVTAWTVEAVSTGAALEAAATLPAVEALPPTLLCGAATLAPVLAPNRCKILNCYEDFLLHTICLYKINCFSFSSQVQFFRSR